MDAPLLPPTPPATPVGNLTPHEDVALSDAQGQRGEQMSEADVKADGIKAEIQTEDGKTVKLTDEEVLLNVSEPLYDAVAPKNMTSHDMRAVTSAEIIARSLLEDILERSDDAPAASNALVEEILTRVFGSADDDVDADDRKELEDALRAFISEIMHKTFEASARRGERHSVKVIEKRQKKTADRREPVLPTITEEMTPCEEYLTVDKIAENFIYRTINKSYDYILKHNIRGKKAPPPEDTPSTSSTMRSDLTSSSNGGDESSRASSVRPKTIEVLGDQVIEWPTIREFTVPMGKNKIIEFMATSWEYQEDWMFCVDFHIAQSDESSDFYLYEATWSLPTIPYPVPQAHASVFFTIEVSRVKPDRCPIEVSYVYESQRFVHKPGHIPFQEKWLLDIIDAKLRFFKSLTF